MVDAIVPLLMFLACSRNAAAWTPRLVRKKKHFSLQGHEIGICRRCPLLANANHRISYKNPKIFFGQLRHTQQKPLLLEKTAPSIECDKASGTSVWLSGRRPRKPAEYTPLTFLHTARSELSDKNSTAEEDRPA